MQLVEIMVGLLVWGGLLVLVSLGVMRLIRGPKPGPEAGPRRPIETPPGPPGASPTSPRPWPVLGETEREAGALVDGLIIGHHLTRTHYRDRLEDQAETIDALRADVAAAWYPGDDTEPDDEHLDDDYPEGFDGPGSARWFGPGAHDPDLESGLDGSDAVDDPWEDDIFGFDEDGDD